MKSMNELSIEEPLILDITGMTCAACSSRIEKVVSKMDGVEKVSVNLAMNRASVLYDHNRIHSREIEEKIIHLGYGVQQKSTSNKTGEESDHHLKHNVVTSFLAAIPFMWAMAHHYEFSSNIWVPDIFLHPWFQFILATYIQFVIGYPFYNRAYQALKNKSANMDVLVVMGASVAYFYSHYLLFTGHTTHLFFDASAMIFSIVLFGKWIEAKTKRQVRGTFQQLQQLQVQTARIWNGTEEKEIPLQHVDIGDLLLIRPGEIIPIDGTITQGVASVDESVITGESLPVEKNAGDSVISGTYNRDGLLIIKATRGARQSTIANMIRLLEEAQLSKPKIQRLADQLSGIFVPVIIGIAAIAFLLRYLYLEPGDVHGALETAITVLVVACPCALGLATPISIMVGTSKAASSGILFKSGVYLENLFQADTIMLDKTGTLTQGKPQIVTILTDKISEIELLKIVASAEQFSEHPLAKAIVEESVNKNINLLECHSFQAFPGYGVQAVVAGNHVRVGSVKWFEQLEIRAAIPDSNSQFASKGKSILCAAINGKWVGTIVFSDKLKPTSKKAVRLLRQQGYRVVMVTGDRKDTASAIAQMVGIQEWYAEMTPSDKLFLVKRFQKNGNKVVMVGDGINDAPAMAAAELGISMGSGTDLTKASANIYLLNNDLGSIVKAIRLSRHTISNIRQNFLLSLLYNAIAVSCALMGFLEPWMACTAMALSSITVICNALRLKLV